MKSNGWHSDGASHERRQWGFFCLELLPILPLSLSLTLTHCPSLSLPPSLSRLWNPTAVLIPRILLQGLISFPFLERLFKYCYIYSQQQNSLPPSQAAAEQQRSTDEGEKSRSYSSIPFKFCLSFMSLSLSSSVYFCLNASPTLFAVNVRNYPPSTLRMLHVRVFQECFAFCNSLLLVSVYMNTGSINGPCVIVLIRAARRTARDPHGTRL